MAPQLPDHDRPNRLRSHPIRYGELVAHLSDYSRVFVATCNDPEEGQTIDDFVAQPNMATQAHPHLPAGATTPGIALMSARDCVEPTSYRAALANAQAHAWHAVMQQEYDFLVDNGTWELVDLPAGRTVVNNMRIYKIKSDTEGEVSRLKARFVAKGCSQRAGLDYMETFSPVIRMASLRLFLAMAAAMDLDLCQHDIDTAFMYAPIKEDAYIR
jgi:hypothetical protein